jgi:hypothetical protein
MADVPMEHMGHTQKKEKIQKWEKVYTFFKLEYSLNFGLVTGLKMYPFNASN